MMKAKLWIIVVAFAVSAPLAGGCGGKPRKTTPLTGKSAGRNLLFVTLDTTRADRIGCYGYKEAATPTIDALAAKGTLFEETYAQAPLTMVSHSCMMTGLYPKEHGIRDNGNAALDPSNETLAELFKAKGYQTGAFVATYVLDRRFGLSQGFDTYDDDVGGLEAEHKGAERQRTGDLVTNSALAWLEAHKASPFFCWVHYYDPHEPYAPPPEFRKAHAKAYDGEIAFMDTQIKRLTDWLAAQKLTDNTTIVLLGDHGEAFGEHGEKGHAMFLYQMNLHVPFVIVDPSAPAGKRVPTLVEVVDIFPTIVDLFKLDATRDVMSRCLSPALAGQNLPDENCYSESHLLYNSHGYAEQRSLTTRDWKYISSTRPELYDRNKDPEELHNLIDGQAATAKQMLTRLLDRFESWKPGQPTQVTQTEESRKALQSLGYVSGGAGKTSSEFLTPGLPDPKDMLSVVLQHQEANKFFHQGKYAEAIPLLEDVLRKSPKSLVVYYSLGVSYLEEKRYQDAIKIFEQGLKLDRTNAAMFISMASALSETGQDEQALTHLKASLGLEDTNPVAYFKMGQTLSKMNRTPEAIENFRKAIKLRPDFSEAIADLALLLSDRGSKDEAMKLYREAVKLHPTEATARFNLGVFLLRGGQQAEAEAPLREAIRLKPDYGEAHLNLGICLAVTNRVDEARACFEKAVTIPGSEAEGHYNLGVSFEKANEAANAVGHFEKALEKNPAHVGATEALVRFYIRNRLMPDVVRVLRKGVAAAPDNLKLVNTLADILATAQDANLRNGAEAVKLATAACEGTQRKAPALLGTLAAAYAEAGDFEKAVQTATEALQKAKDANQTKLIESLSAQLEKFKAGHPERNPKY